MAKVKLTKTELKAQSDALKRFQRFLPMLQLKKQQLQAEIAGIVQKAEAVTAREQAARAALGSWVGLFAAGGEEALAGLVEEAGAGFLYLLFGPFRRFGRFFRTHAASPPVWER